MMRKSNQFGTCRSCGMQILWIDTIGGKKMPCNPQFVYYKAHDGGKDRIVLPNGQVVAGTIQERPEYADGHGYISHFATCQCAQMFRRKKKSEAR